MTEKQTTINVTMLTGKNSGFAELRGTTVERLIAVDGPELNSIKASGLLSGINYAPEYYFVCRAEHAEELVAIIGQKSSNETTENPLAAFLNLASEIGKVFLSVSAAIQHDYEFPRKFRSNSDAFWNAFWRLGDNLRDFHEFGDFYARPVHEDNESGTVRAWANARILGCVDNTRNLLDVISKADPELANRLTYLTAEVEKAATICLKQVEKQIGH